MDRNKSEAIGILVVLSIIWGSSFILMKKGMLVYAPDQVASLRIVLAAIVFLPYFIIKIRKVKKLKFILAFAFLEIGIPPYLYTYAQTVVDSSTAGILNSLVPLFTLIAGALIYKIKADRMKVAGVFLGLLGAVLLVYYKSDTSLTFDIANSYGLLIVLATLMYGIGGNILKEHLEEVPGTVITATAFVMMAIPAGIYLSTTNIFDISLAEPQNLKAMSYIAILSFFGSALAIVLFSILIKKSNALFGAFITYFIPFVAIFWGYSDGENIHIMHFVSLLTILAGIYLANKESYKKPSVLKNNTV